MEIAALLGDSSSRHPWPRQRMIILTLLGDGLIIKDRTLDSRRSNLCYRLYSQNCEVTGFQFEPLMEWILLCFVGISTSAKGLVTINGKQKNLICIVFGGAQQVVLY
uniref:Uncharacterized protein n=1 Tax=Kalanchoe fedtschenkoi TaxID=63787 RepID=A0A7N0TQM2_KALFE